MKINISHKNRAVLRFAAIFVPAILVAGMVLEVVGKWLFPPHHIDWQGVAIEAVTIVLGIAVIVGLSALLPPASNRNS